MSIFTRVTMACLAGLVASALLVSAFLAGPSRAAEEGGAAAEPHFPLLKPERESWSFSGMFGRFDRAQLRRGLQVYRDVCANCHTLSLVPFRMLTDPEGPGLSDEEMRELAASYPVTDGVDAAGQPVTRPGGPTDHFPNPYATADIAAASNSGAVPPDLSLMAKARGVSYGFPWFLVDGVTQYQEGGPDYIHALLTGYSDTVPETVHLPEGTNYNPYFVAAAGIAMPQPLFDEAVTYPKGVPTTIDQYSRDVSAFLMWAAEPHLVERKRLGLQVLIFLVVFAGLMYLTKRRVWAAVQH